MESTNVNVTQTAAERAPGNGRSAWLATLMLKRRGRILPRFAMYCRKLAALPRPWRARLQRKLAVTLTGAALLLALVQPTIQAAPDNTITVVNGEVADVENGKCSLIEAIINARAVRVGQLRADCAPGNLSGADTIVLPNNGLFELTAAHNEQFGPTALPVITRAMTIEGNGSTITRVIPSDPFRILVVDPGRKLTLRNTTISHGNADFSSINNAGGGILNFGTLVMENSVVSGSFAYQGGGIHNEGTATIINSTIDGNDAENDGGGIGNHGTMTIDRSTISNNTGTYYGAGVFNGGQMTITNSTISGNYMILEEGGGIYNAGEMTISNSTVTGNYAYGGDAGILNMDYATLHLNRTIISGNYSLNFDTYYFDYADEIGNAGTIIADNYNLIGHDGNAYSGNFTPGPTDIVPAEPLSAILDTTLANNGGPTETHALLSGSPAVDAAPSNACTAAPVSGVDQRGQPRNQNGDGASSAKECDIGAFELGGSTPPGSAAFFISATKNGTVDGLAFHSADILKFEAGNWSIHFDASDVGIKKNVNAFEILDDNSILLSFVANQPIPGLGTVRPQDVVRFIPSSTGSNTAGSFEWYFDGSDFLLTKSGEKIDALGEAADGRLLISTTGAAAVKLPNGQNLKAQDEDVLGFDLNTEEWSLFFDGTPLAGLKAEDVNALWADRTTGDIYLSLMNAFNLSGVQGNGRDIVKLTPNGNSYTPSLFWDGSAAGFPQNLDGLEIIQ